MFKIGCAESVLEVPLFAELYGYGHFASHVGIYIGNNQMVHAGDGGVGIADLDDPYFVRHYMCSRRVVLSGMPLQAELPDPGMTQDMNGSYWRENSQTDWSGDSFFAAKSRDRSRPEGLR